MASLLEVFELASGINNVEKYKAEIKGINTNTIDSFLLWKNSMDNKEESIIKIKESKAALELIRNKAKSGRKNMVE